MTILKFNLPVSVNKLKLLLRSLLANNSEVGFSDLGNSPDNNKLNSPKH